MGLKHSLRVLLALLVAAPAATSLAGEMSLRVQAQAATEDAAIDAALMRAVEQVYGLSISSRSERSVSEQRASGYDNARDYSAGEVAVRQDSVTRSAARGLVKSFRVLDSERLGSAHRVELQVKLPTYQTPGLPSDKRRRMVVADFAARQAHYRLPAGELPGALAAERLREAITRAITQSRRLAVLDRAHDRALEDEFARLRSGQVPVAEKARLGQALGADYLLVGSIIELDGAREPRVIRASGERYESTRIAARVHYEVIALATRQVKWADEVVVALDIRDAPEQGVFGLVGNRLARTMLNNIYPLRVVSAAGGQLVLNQGADSIAQGERFEVFNLGETLVDPYTKEPLGKIEQRVGLVEVVRVAPKMAYAELLEGDAAAVQQHAILRPYQAPAGDAPDTTRRESQVETSADGGVRLPFDRR
ncbi:CsgG/HfaB family protein [Alkalilimnicola sp. S0819]|uniref:CsgG/HfaB family protein n=1 Tax=Alkalilimnicola sp. S0819 TaxID=2613922 RepID=UPI0012618519|nr:CsgG/HfaB family protein [Alkalilimnicola sp. S0819]KAB7624114.1 hypothetical protein F3N43_06920 [Alkalilimnicola sp. S0819]MPQ16366.1 hypothetical protein [Alkalilimnicola sp. S0819]